MSLADDQCSCEGLQRWPPPRGAPLLHATSAEGASAPCPFQGRAAHSSAGLGHLQAVLAAALKAQIAGACTVRAGVQFSGLLWLSVMQRPAMFPLRSAVQAECCKVKKLGRGDERGPESLRVLRGRKTSKTDKHPRAATLKSPSCRMLPCFPVWLLGIIPCLGAVVKQNKSSVGITHQRSNVLSQHLQTWPVLFSHC